MKRKLLWFAGAQLALTAALCLAPGAAVCAFAQTYYLDKGSVTVEARDGKQYVTQEGGESNVLQTNDTVISQTDSSTATTNTVTVSSASGQAAKLTLGGVNIDVSGASKAAMSTNGAGDVTVTLDGHNVLKSGENHAGLEKNSTGNLTITAEDTGQSLYAEGGGGNGDAGAGIGGRGDTAGTGITISGGKVTAKGGNSGHRGGAGIGGGGRGAGSSIVISGGEVTATGGAGTVGGAGIGGGAEGAGSGIVISGGEVAATGATGLEGGGAGVGGGGRGATAEIRVWDAVQLKVQGGRAAGGGSGGIGVDPDTSELTSEGWIRYYATGADMSTAVPTSTTAGTHSHSWSEWTVVPATCIADGSRTRTCTVNNSYTEAETIPATGHRFTAEEPEGKYLKSVATCTEKAVYYKSCSVCGESSKGTDDEATFEYGGPLDHDWGEATYTWSKDHSSCTATRTCKNDENHKETETATATAEVTQEKSCTDDELTTYTATFKNAAFEEQVLEDMKTAGATGHSFTAETAEPAHLKSAATCTKKAVYYKSCSVCGESSEGTDDEATFEHGDPLGHKGGTATCAHKAVCETCGEEYGELDPTNHGELAHVAAKAATAKAEGNTEYWHCAECDKYFSDEAGTKEISKADTVIAKKSEPRKEEKKALPKTGDDATTQLSLLLAGGFTALGAVFIVKKRAA